MGKLATPAPKASVRLEDVNKVLTARPGPYQALKKIKSDFVIIFTTLSQPPYLIATIASHILQMWKLRQREV